MNNIAPTIAWFSCGATSAVACHLALTYYPNVRIVYIETGSGHPDNYRFIRDCERWYGQTIEILQSERFVDVLDVLRKRRFINSPHGAACTYFLKKLVRARYEDTLKSWFGQVWGFDFCKREINRAIRFKEQYPLTKPLFPLIERSLTKEACLSVLLHAGIELPAMYRLGYSNNNCIGCVKGGMSYWNKIRVDFPEAFANMASVERELNATCLKTKQGERLFLDELDPNLGRNVKPLVPDCSLSCAIEFQDLMDKRTSQILHGQMSINAI